MNGRPAAEELNPYWFNQDDMSEFFRARAKDGRERHRP
jgi:hypothetical protein